MYIYHDGLGRIHREGNEPAEIHSTGHCYHYKYGELVCSENRRTMDEQIDEIMEEFDFEKVRNVMLHLKWRWLYEGIPSVEDIKEESRRLLVDSYDSCYKHEQDNCSIGCGGLKATYHMNRGFNLEFILESWETFP